MKTIIRKARKLLSLKWQYQLLVFPIFLLLGANRLRIHFIPFKKLASHNGKHCGSLAFSLLSNKPKQNTRAKRIGRLVEQIANNTPWESKCLVQAMTAQILLKQLNIPHVMFFGLGKTDAKDPKPLKAHAWLTSDRIHVTGGNCWDEFTIVSSFATTCGEIDQERKKNRFQKVLFELCGNEKYRGHHQELITLITQQSAWNIIYELAEWHRVIPHLYERTKKYNNLSSLTSINKTLSREIKNQTIKTLNIYSEILSINDLFIKENIDYAVFKGVAFCKLFGINTNQRHTGDLDILINKEKIWHVDSLFVRNGYRKIEPIDSNLELSLREKREILLKGKDICYINYKKNTKIEIHFKLFHNDSLYPVSTQTLLKRREFITINKIKIPALSIYDHKTYLLAHAAYSGLYRLKWVIDIKTISESGVSYTEKSTTLKIEEENLDRIASLMISLCNQLLNTNIDLIRNTNPIIIKFLVEHGKKALEARKIPKDRRKSLPTIPKTREFILKIIYKNLLKSSLKYKTKENIILLLRNAPSKLKF